MRCTIPAFFDSTQKALYNSFIQKNRKAVAPMKKLLVLLALSLFALVEELETFMSEDFEYTLLPDGTAEITR